MKSTTNGAKLHQEDATLLALRRRRKKLIAVFSIFLVSLALTIAALLTFLILDRDSETFDRTRTTTVDPSLRAFCSFVDSTPSCLASLDPIIYTKPVTNPNQIFTLSLQTAAEELELLISSLSNLTDQSDLSGCSSSVREALNQINVTLSFVDQLQRYYRDRMMDGIVAAEEDLKGCAADESGMVNSTGAGEVLEEKVERAKMFLGYSRDFLSRYDGVWLVSDEAYRYSSDWPWLIRELEENMFAAVLFGLQLSFLGFLACFVLRTRGS